MKVKKNSVILIMVLLVGRIMLKKMNTVTLVCWYFLFKFANADYYWRDYDGEIPSDAFPGGTDKSGNTTYIGQTYFPFPEVFFPTTIFRGDKNAYSDWHGLRKSDKDTKILCTKDHTSLRWISTTTHTMQNLQKCNTLIGGYNAGSTIWIGRAENEGQIHVSKIYDYAPFDWHGLWIWTDGEGIMKDTFQMLTYGCEGQED